MISYQNLDVYKRSIEFLARSQGILSNCPKGHSVIADQLRRAALSIPLNIAEGSGKTAVKDKKRYWAIARGSAMECAAIVDVCRVLEIIDGQRYEEASEVLLRITQMLTKMCR